MYDQFVGTKPVEERHRFDVARLSEYMRANVEGFSGELEVEQFRGGQSNPTYRLSAGLIHGLAWIDTGDFHIMRLHTDLLNPAPEVRLQKQTTEIQYQPVEFQGLSTPLWLPREVKVTVDWRGRILRNRHQYSDFKLFSTESRDEIKTPKIPATVPKEQLQ